MDKNSENKNYYAAVIMTILFLSFFCVNYAHYQLSPIAAELMAKYDLTIKGFTAAFSAPMLPGIFLALLGGSLSDKYGVRKVLSWGLAVSLIALWLRVLVKSSAGFYLTMVLLGVGVSLLYSTYAKIISSWLSKKRMGIIGAVILSAASVGMAIAVGTTALISSINRVFLISAGIFTIVFLLFLIFMQDPRQEEETHQPSLRECFQTIRHCRPVFIAAIGHFLGLAICNIVGSTLPTSLMENNGLSAAQAGSLTSILMLGTIAGSLLLPYIVSKKGYFRLLVVSNSILYGVCIILARLLATGFSQVLILFLLGFAQGGILTLILSTPAYMPEIGPVYGGTAGGIIVTAQMLGAFLLPSFVVVPLAGGNTSNILLIAAIMAFLIALVSLLFPAQPFGKSKD